MTLTRRTLFRGAFAACAFFATRRVLPGVEEESERDRFYAILDKRSREFYDDWSEDIFASMITLPRAGIFEIRGVGRVTWFSDGTCFVHETREFRSMSEVVREQLRRENATA